MIRRFGTSTQRLALSRARSIGKPAVSRASRPASASTASTNGSSTTNTTPVKPRTLQNNDTLKSPAAAAAGRTASPASSATNTKTSSSSSNERTSEFSPRLVPGLATQATSTPVSEVVDPQEVVSDIPDLESTEGLSEDWATSFQGLGSKPFEPHVIEILMAPVVPEDVEVTPDGLIYLPEIKYRRILNRAFGPGGWGIAPRTKTLVTKRQVTREYGLVCLGRLVSVSRGEMDYFSAEGVTTAMEGCKSNALMRCCKDLGIASELWDPTFIRQFKAKYCDSKYYEKKRRFVWKLKSRPWDYPYNQ